MSPASRSFAKLSCFLSSTLAVVLLLAACSSDGPEVNPTSLVSVRSFDFSRMASLATNGELLAVGQHELLAIYEIRNGTDATEVGRIEWPGWNHAPRHLAFSGDVLFVNRGSELLILDVSDPASPTTLSATEVGEIDLMRVRDDRVYLLIDPGAQRVEVLHVFDVSNPASPENLGSAELSAPDFSLYGDYAYGGHRNDRYDQYYPGQIQVVRVVPPIEQVAWTDLRGGTTHVDGSRLFVARTSGMDVHDLSNPEAPQPIHLEPESALGGGGTFLSWKGWILRTNGPTVDYYPANSNAPSAPTHVTGGGRTLVGGLAHDHRFLYVAYVGQNLHQPNGLEILRAP